MIPIYYDSDFIVPYSVSPLVCVCCLCVMSWLLCCTMSKFVDLCTPDRKWVAYSKLYQSLEVDSSVLFQQLTSIEYHWHQQQLPHQQVWLLHGGSVLGITSNQELIFKHKWVLRKVSRSLNRNRNLGTLFMVSCIMDCVWWPNTETSSPQLPMLPQNYTHYSGTAKCYIYVNIQSKHWE